MFENVFVNCEEVSMRFGHFDDEHREYVNVFVKLRFESVFLLTCRPDLKAFC